MENLKDKPMKNIGFRFMSAFFVLRDLFSDPMKKIIKAKVKKGDFVLDYGCGPGSFSVTAAKVVGDLGKVYAADIQPLSAEKVLNKAEKEGLNNIETITTDCDTGLHNNSIDVILCFDMFHMLSDQRQILEEFGRILKPDGILSLDDHHMKEIESKVIETGLFKINEKIDKTYNFRKNI
ncbi:MAG: methyltransferase domain-containing protein [Candidatus Lokiarchaeota archaeon]|nr:methyltransferase domain-containing protein [Candidatus Lokiarchaeota archaeon]